jgi:hypothetical protein
MATGVPKTGEGRYMLIFKYLNTERQVAERITDRKRGNFFLKIEEAVSEQQSAVSHSRADGQDPRRPRTNVRADVSVRHA